MLLPVASSHQKNYAELKNQSAAKATARARVEKLVGVYGVLTFLRR